MFVPSIPAVVCIASLIIPTISAIPTISIKGSKFFAGGEQFFLKGVAYQGTPEDPLRNATQCEYDATLMKSIGVNSIRVYHVDPKQDHDPCMQIFEDANIYVWLDLETFHNSINQDKPRWDEGYFMDYVAVVETFRKYDNVGGFWIGNEVINYKNGSLSAPYIKACVADMKAYMAQSGGRNIPIGYAAADIAELRPMVQNYLICGSYRSQSIDFFGLNTYSWCGEATYESSGYVFLQKMAKDHPVPIFLSETGCNVGGERTFNDQAAIFGPEMIDTFSGAIVYEWVEEVNHYGLVTYPHKKIYSGAPIAVQPDFDNLSKQWKQISPTGVKEQDYTPTPTIPPCPTPTEGWLIDGDVPLPSIDTMMIAAAAKLYPKSGSTSLDAGNGTSLSISVATETATITQSHTEAPKMSDTTTKQTINFASSSVTVPHYTSNENSIKQTVDPNTASQSTSVLSMPTSVGKEFMVPGSPIVGIDRDSIESLRSRTTLTGQFKNEATGTEDSGTASGTVGLSQSTSKSASPRILDNICCDYCVASVIAFGFTIGLFASMWR